ncbi:MAG: hypothetical protein NVS2B17_02530 [Candidatus Velthaea sp.]
MNYAGIIDANARRALEVPADAPLLVITGAAASGKTETLARRFAALLAAHPELTIASTIVTAARADGAAALRARIAGLLPFDRAAEFTREGRYSGVTLERLAFDLLAEHATAAGLAYDLEEIDIVDAEEIFERAIAPLFSREWSDFLGPEIDPEIPGLRAPDRFAAAVLRLIRKLREAHIGPDDFLAASLRGAAAFYANPPNLSAPALLFATKDEHRPSLTVNGDERERQRKREIDLAKIITRVYQSYLDELIAYGCLTAADALAEATRLISEHPAIGRGLRARFRLALVDDVHDLHTGEFRLLQAIFGKTLRGVTVAGDPDAATEMFAGARPDRVFGAAAATIALQAGYRVPAQIAALVRAVLDPQAVPAVPSGEAIALHRASDPAAEASFVARAVAELIAGGTAPGRIAVVHRSARTLTIYEDALLERNVPIVLLGDAALFARHDTLDALGLLWCAVDPFRHAWLLRVLQMPLLRFSDATLATLCGEPASAQGLLFDLPPQEDSEGNRRWDRRRDLRLGTNVVRGDRDPDLDVDARERLVAFRARRDGWQGLVHDAGSGVAARAVLTDGGMFEARPGEPHARTQHRGAIVERLLALIDRYAERYPMDDLAGALAYCERIARSENGPTFETQRDGAVVVASIDRIKSRRFDHVFVVDVRAGSFPPYYVPDAFLFSPTYGMIPKDSVGDAITARTAKFTWYAHQAKLRETYAREDRRALAAALARADISVSVSASGRATRGVGAPEFLAELQAIRPALPLAEANGKPVVLENAPEANVEPADAATSVATPRMMSIERAAALTHCVRCAPRRALVAALRSPAPLLRSAEQTEPACIAVTIEGAIVSGTIDITARDERRYVVVRGDDAHAYAALAILALGDFVVAGNYYVRLDDASLDGPHPLAPQTITSVRAVLAGHSSPLCNLCTE